MVCRAVQLAVRAVFAITAIVSLVGIVQGTEMDQDYFTAAQDPKVRKLLHLVEKFHTDEVTRSLAQQRYDVAMQDLRYTLQRFPNHPKALQLVGVVARLRGNPAVARGYFDRAVTLFPGYAVTQAQYGTFLVQTGDVQKGLDRLKKAVSMDPDLGLAHAWLAEAYEKTGQAALSREAAARAQALGYRSTSTAGQPGGHRVGPSEAELPK